MTEEPQPAPPTDATAEPEVDQFDDPEEFAEAVGPDPTPDQVDQYRERVEQPD